jgi:hypothetical protein
MATQALGRDRGTIAMTDKPFKPAFTEEEMRQWALDNVAALGLLVKKKPPSKIKRIVSALKARLR